MIPGMILTKRIIKDDIIAAKQAIDQIPENRKKKIKKFIAAGKWCCENVQGEND